MKKSTEILGLPIISITEGRELGLSQTLLIDSKKSRVAAITIEDEDWYRGVKLIPFESIVVIGEDAIIITSSENILRYDADASYESLLSANIRVLGTKAITKSGTIKGKVTEIFIGDDGKIEKCEVTAPDGSVGEIEAGEVAIFGKQVTMIDADAKKKPVTETTVPANSFVEEELPEIPVPVETPEIATQDGYTESLEELDAATVEPAPDLDPDEDDDDDDEETVKPTNEQAEALKAALKRAIEKGAGNSKGAKRNSPAQSKRVAADEKRPLMLLGKKAARTIKASTGAVIVEAGAEITEEVLQKARLAGKFIELSMNYVP